jgi:hypothetical protein
VLWVLTWSLWLKIRHDKGNGSKECSRIQRHFHKCGKVQWSEFQHFQMDFHFGSWNLTNVLNFWKVWKNLILSKLRFIWNVGKVLKNKYLKWAPIIHLKHKLWPKRRLKIKLIIWFSMIQTYEKWVKWPLNETCNKVMEIYF